MKKVVLEKDKSEQAVSRFAMHHGLAFHSKVEGDAETPSETIWTSEGAEDRLHRLDDPISGLLYLIIEGTRETELSEAAAEAFEGLTTATLATAMSTHDDAALSRSSIAALGVLAPGRCVPDYLGIFHWLLHHKEPAIREAAISASGYAIWPEMVDELDAVSRTDPEPALRDYARAAARAIAEAVRSSFMTPRLSAIMPTADRRRFVPAAIAQFLAQDRDDAELVILDDGADPVGDLVPEHPRLRYVREERRLTLGEKRNRACEIARGEILLHWDDDDWHAPDRLSRQVAALEAADADICGCDRLFFLAEDGMSAWEYVYGGSKPWVAGGTLCYRRSAWQRMRFPAIRSGEDTRWIHAASPGRIHVIRDNSFYVARIHAGNTSPKATRGSWWRPRDPAHVRALVARWEDRGRAAETRSQGDLSIVIPHAGVERLPQMSRTLASLRAHLPQAPIIVVEQGESAVAAGAAEAAGAQHRLVAMSGPFERARALNLGTAMARTDYVLWHDNDLIATPGFHARALDEMLAQGLDFFIPYSIIHYLSQADTRRWIDAGQLNIRVRPQRSLRPGTQVAGGMGLVRRDFVRAYGGLDERFRGWGGEDNGWWHKACLLGRTGISRGREQHLWHLWHPASGGTAGRAAQEGNPAYRDNLALLAEMARATTRDVFLARFPPVPLPDPEATDRPAPTSGDLPVWLYWEGPCPAWIERCRETILRHGGNVNLLDRAAFEALRADDADIDLDPLLPAHRADYARAFLLARHGGIWLDSDCILMRPLDEVRAAVRRAGFVAHRDRQGYFPNGFMAAAKGNDLAERFYRAVAERLRAGGTLGWIELGGAQLTRLLTGAGARFAELPCAAIQPICWSEPARFFERGDPARHAARFDAEATTYMLSNTEIAKHVGKAAGADLMAPNSFFTYLVGRSLGTILPTALPAIPRPALAEAGRGTTPAEVFASFHRAALARVDDSLSGPGSSIAQTAALRSALPALLRALGVSSMLDAGCGDHRWLAEVDLRDVDYVGMDIVPDLVARNAARGLVRRRFVAGDFTADPLPRADLVLARDTLGHYDLARGLAALRNIAASGATWLLATTFPARMVNEETALGGWRPLNMTLTPFGFPAPSRLLDERCTENGGLYRDKALGLWRIANLPIRAD